ncbi:MAG: anti-sigma factor [Acidobacteriota bacterium]
MTSPESQSLLEQLLAAEATQGLSDLETLELERLLEEHGTNREDQGYEQAAAALEMAFHAARTPSVPPSLNQGLEELAARASRGGDLLQFPSPARQVETDETSSSKLSLWFFAAAAAITLLSFAPRLLDRNATTPLEAPVETIAADEIRLEMAPTKDPAAVGAQGEVIWSNAGQRGEMRISGLEANDPAVSQYQLWIFDAAQDERYPIDGGVFDVVGGQAVIPIDAGIEVRSPTLFAITVEKPGGVVVSGRERIVLLAPVA